MTIGCFGFGCEAPPTFVSPMEGAPGAGSDGVQALPEPAPTECPAPTEDRLKIGLDRHHVNYGGLLVTRFGRQIQPLGGPSKAQEWTIDSLMRKATNNAKIPAANLTLFYDLADDCLSSWLSNEHGRVVASAAVPLPMVRTKRWVHSLSLALQRDVGSEPRTSGPRQLPFRGSKVNDSGEFDSIAVAGRLTETLFPPDITKAIIDRAERTGPINLVVVPARELGTIPFVLLPIGPGREPLVQYASVTIAPSLRTLGLRVAPHATALRGGLAMGNPDLTRHKKLRLDALPGAESEAKRVGQVAGTRPILGKEATKQAFSSAVAKGPPLIFLATHGISNPQDPLDGSFVVLADGRLTAREIQKMRLMGRPLVVLSACQTGLGQAHEGGVIGLARGFHLAGAGSVVMSLWDVDDKATEALMTAFVEHLPNHCPARALRLAMQDLRKKGYPPSQWAGFTVFGDYCEFPPPSTR